MGRYARSRCRLHLEEWTSLKTSLAPFLFLFFLTTCQLSYTYSHTCIHTNRLLVVRANLPDRFNSPCATGQEERKRVRCGSPLLEYRDSRLSITHSSSSASDNSPRAPLSRAFIFDATPVENWNLTPREFNQTRTRYRDFVITRLPIRRKNGAGSSVERRKEKYLSSRFLD